MTKVEQTQVLIAGGGPVGLVAALRAAKRGLDVIVPGHEDLDESAIA